MTRDAGLRKAEFREIAREIVRFLPGEPNKAAVIARALERAYRSGAADASSAAPPPAPEKHPDGNRTIPWITIPPRPRSLLELLLHSWGDTKDVGDLKGLIRIAATPNVPASIGGERWIVISQSAEAPAAARGNGYSPQSVRVLERLGLLQIKTAGSGNVLGLPTETALASYLDQLQAEER